MRAQFLAKVNPIKVNIILSNGTLLGPNSIVLKNILGASLWSGNRVLVIRLVAVGSHEGAVERVHPSALVVPHPEPAVSIVQAELLTTLPGLNSWLHPRSHPLLVVDANLLTTVGRRALA